MKFMRVACWVWIVVSTTLILFWSPVAVTRQADKYQVTRIEWIGPFGEPLGPRSNITKSSIDFSRMIAALLAANFLPAVILWRFKTIGEWLHRHKGKFAMLRVLAAHGAAERPLSAKATGANPQHATMHAFGKLKGRDEAPRVASHFIL